MVLGKYSFERIDSYNITLYETKIRQKGKKAGEEFKDVIGYYSNVEAVCIKLLDLVIGQNLTDIKSILNGIKEAKEEIRKELANNKSV